MYVRKILIKNFRSFSSSLLEIDNRFVAVLGDNGAGKTSLFEALYYCSYLRSFRTNSVKDLFRHGSDHFFLQVDYNKLNSEQIDCLRVGINHNQRIVKVNDSIIRTHKELISQFPVVILSADDIELIKGYPEGRRAFLNYSAVLRDPSLLSLLKSYRRALLQRNSLLVSRDGRKGIDDALYFWTEQVWEKTCALQNSHSLYLRQLEETMNQLLSSYFSPFLQGAIITITYEPRHKSQENFLSFMDYYKQKLFERENLLKRTCFGAHLDDFKLTFREGSARIFASRGQQKLLVFLLKLSQIIQNKQECLFLLDDFLTDFDQNTLERSITALTSNDKGSVLISSPVKSSSLEKILTPQTILL